MEREQVKRWEQQCIEEQAPACTSTCPLHVDARDLAVAAANGDFKKGLALLANSVPLPRILAHVCDHPCQSACRRSEAGDPIAIGLLERACSEFGGVVPQLRAQPANGKRVAIVGGGLSGMSAAVRLGVRGYTITLYEAGPRLLSRMRSLDTDLLPANVIESELAILETLPVRVHSGALISRHEGPFGIDALVVEFDAVLLATGPALFDESSLGLERTRDGRIRVDALTLGTSNPKLFVGGAQRYGDHMYSPVMSVADGAHAAVSIDRFLQGASLEANRENQGTYPSRLYVNTAGIAPTAVVPRTAGAHGYTREEAKREATRCYPCRCLECVKVCPYLEEYGSYPKSYVRQIYNNESIVMGVRKANRMINSCALCGLCAAVCPERLNMADVCLDARQGMVLRGKMPASTHDFALRDMEFSQSEAFRMARHQPGFASSRVAFLPGCQLAASSPDHVRYSYDYLCKTIDGGVGLIFECCGAPAQWAGNESKFQDATNAMESAWLALGSPRLITACSSCIKTLRKTLPHIPVEPLWPYLEKPAAEARERHAGRTLAIHDPCSTRGVEEVEGSARQLLRQLGIKIEELNEPGKTTCCGYGGLMMFANPKVGQKTITRRAQESKTDYVTYCAMCRDRFAHEEKRATHILDLIFEAGEADTAARPDPGLSRRRDNRARLKEQMLHEIWGETETSMETPANLRIAEELRRVLESRLILEQDIRRTVEHAESNKDWIQDRTTGLRLASLHSGCVTYWVEYSVLDGVFTVRDAYSHRMEVR